MKLPDLSDAEGFVSMIKKSEGKRGLDLILYRAKIVKKLDKQLKKKNISKEIHRALIEMLLNTIE